MHLIRVMECKNEKHDCLPGATHICMRDNVSSISVLFCLLIPIRHILPL